MSSFAPIGTEREMSANYKKSEIDNNRGNVSQLSERQEWGELRVVISIPLVLIRSNGEACLGQSSGRSKAESEHAFTTHAILT